MLPTDTALHMVARLDNLSTISALGIRTQEQTLRSPNARAVTAILRNIILHGT